jgi:hypothetical protein
VPGAVHEKAGQVKTFKNAADHGRSIDISWCYSMLMVFFRLRSVDRWSNMPYFQMFHGFFHVFLHVCPCCPGPRER